jgi:predicted transcriptional regulator
MIQKTTIIRALDKLRDLNRNLELLSDMHIDLDDFVSPLQDSIEELIAEHLTETDEHLEYALGEICTWEFADTNETAKQLCARLHPGGGWDNEVENY